MRFSTSCYLASRSIWIPILLHVLNNGTAILMAAHTYPEQISKPTPIELWIAAYVLLITGGFALWTSRAKEEPREHADEAWSEHAICGSRNLTGISAPPPEANVRIGYTSKVPRREGGFHCSDIRVGSVAVQ